MTRLKELSPEQFDQLVAATAAKTTAAGGVLSLGGFTFSSTDIGLIGTGIALAGFIVNWYYRHKEYTLKEREYRRKFPSTEVGKLED